jgi:hypothetical protein
VAANTQSNELSARREAMLEICRESMRAAAVEAVEHLWLPRLYRKISRQLRPDPWWEVLADYQERWCESTGTWHRRSTKLECEWIRDPRREGPEGYVPDFDFIRCIVFGWADGSDPEGLEHWVTRWREELNPAIQWLNPVTTSSVPGPALLTYVTQTLPEIRPQLEEIIDGWPDSPPALAGLLSDFAPAADLLQQFRDQTTPDPAKDALDDRGQGVPYALEAIALGDEVQALHRLANRGARLAEILADAKRSLAAMGWAVSENGELQEARPTTPGSKPAYLVQIIQGLYVYLRPFYQRTFGDTTANPAALRMHISLLLSPYFEPAKVNPRRQGTIWHAINNHLFH